MSEVNEVGRILDAIKRLSPEHRQRAESVAVVVEQALASAQTTIAALEKRIAELEASVGLIAHALETLAAAIRARAADRSGK